MEIKIKNIELLFIKNTLDELSNQTETKNVSTKAKFKMAYTLKKVYSELELYNEQMNTLLESCALKGKDGQYVVEKDGNGNEYIKLQEDKAVEYQKQRMELDNSEIVIVLNQFTETEIDEFKPTIQQIFALQKLIEGFE